MSICNPVTKEDPDMVQTRTKKKSVKQAVATIAPRKSNAAGRTLRQEKKPGGNPGVEHAGKPFLPASISLDFFLVDGSDREFRELIYKVLSISTMMLRARERFATAMGVTGPQYSMMVAIGEANTATVGYIAQKLHVSSPFVTAEIGKLITHGIVERRPNEADRRSNLLALTRHGRDLIHKIGPLRCITNDTIFGGLTPRQAHAFREIVDRLLTDSEKALCEIQSPAWNRKLR